MSILNLLGHVRHIEVTFRGFLNIVQDLTELLFFAVRGGLLEEHYHQESRDLEVEQVKIAL
jgi:hypothetical protein